MPTQFTELNHRSCSVLLLETTQDQLLPLIIEMTSNGIALQHLVCMDVLAADLTSTIA